MDNINNNVVAAWVWNSSEKPEVLYTCIRFFGFFTHRYMYNWSKALTRDRLGFLGEAGSVIRAYCY